MIPRLIIPLLLIFILLSVFSLSVLLLLVVSSGRRLLSHVDRVGPALLALCVLDALDTVTRRYQEISVIP